MTWLGVGVAVVAVLLPGSGWALIGTTPGPAYLDAARSLATAAGLALAGACLARWDRWLGGFVLAAAVASVAVGTDLALAIAHWVALGAGGLVLVRMAAEAGHGRVLVGVLVAAGLAQAALAVGAVLWWRPWWYEHAPTMALGTFGNPKFLGAFLAVVVPVAPLWALPPLLLGVALSQSALAGVAAFVGLLVQPRVSWVGRMGLGAAGLAAALGAVWTRGAGLGTLAERQEAWRIAFADLTPLDALIGHGAGAWLTTVPYRQINAAGPSRMAWPEELFAQPHSDLVGLFYAGGLVAVTLAAGWLWSHRHALRVSPWRGAAVAVGVECALFHPLHLATLAPAYVVVLGLATAEAPHG